MAKGNRRFGPADQAVVITQLLGGATVAAAAKAAGFAVQTLYDDRKRCPLFARAWADAVAESARPRLVARGTGGWWQIKTLRRNRFARARKEAFLGALAANPDIGAAAEAAGVCRATVYSHRESDPGFASAWREALQMGVEAVEARLVAERLAALAAYRVAPDEGEGAGEAAGPAADPVERDLEFWRMLHLLREHKRGLAGVATRKGRRPRVASMEEGFAGLERELDAFAAREARARKRGPPPRCIG
jgi:hypothetical protein